MRSPSSAAVLAFLVTVIVIVVGAGIAGAVSTGPNPAALGAEIGRAGFWVALAAAIGAYVVQTIRRRR